MSNKKAKELKKDIINNEYICSSDSSNEYSFAVEKGKHRKNVILKLNINPSEDVSPDKITKGLVQYITAFEEILTWQSAN